MLRVAQQALCRPRFHDLSAPHHDRLCTHSAHDRQVVADEQQREPLLPADPGDEVEDLRLHRHVESARRLIHHQHLGLDRQCPGDRHTLPLATRQRARTGGEMLLPQPHGGDQLAHALGGVVPGASAVQSQNVLDRSPHRDPRIQREIGILEDHLHALGAFESLGARSRDAGHGPATDRDVPGIRLFESDDHPRQSRLARTRFAHDGERTATGNGEARVDHGGDGFCAAPPVGLAGPRDDELRLGVRHDRRRRDLPRDAGRRGDQAAGVLGRRRDEHLPRRSLLDDRAVLHDDDPVAERPREVEVVGDEQHPHPAPAAEIPQHLDDLRLGRDVECGRRLVADEQTRRRAQRPGDHDPLQHSARQLMRMLRQMICRRGQPDGGEQFDGACTSGILRPALAEPKPLGDVIADRAHRIDTGARILEDHRSLVPTDLLSPGGTLER